MPAEMGDRNQDSRSSKLGKGAHCRAGDRADRL